MTISSDLRLKQIPEHYSLFELFVCEVVALEARGGESHVESGEGREKPLGVGETRMMKAPSQAAEGPLEGPNWGQTFVRTLRSGPKSLTPVPNGIYEPALKTEPQPPSRTTSKSSATTSAALNPSVSTT